MPNFSTLRTKILAICNANSLINEAFAYDKPRFDKTPACTVVPSGNSSDYDTTSENKRTFAFTVTIFVPQDAHGSSDADDTLLAIIDSLIDDFDQDFTLTGSALMLSASPSAWGWQEREKLYRTAEINLTCKTLFDVTS